ncbi:hypothetical protein [Flavobacterium chungangense]|uniref:Uncharacterized protein n=1 Tax=Flavobacterium chungangense TaxID=554283 RepID=A0A6V6ZAA1_9FLAO|nr:hypothetical protein [Flavobacterium chungangense]CAD0007862.1 hypothetical protein FLACHUCJ7_03504 [Flavobacterium chungangense]
MECNTYISKFVSSVYKTFPKENEEPYFKHKLKIGVTDTSYNVTVVTEFAFNELVSVAHNFYVVFFKDQEASLNSIWTELVYQSFSRQAEHIFIKYNHTIEYIPNFFQIYKAIEAKPFESDLGTI